MRIVKDACPILLHEAGRHRYGGAPNDRRGGTPVDDHNHALAALPYLVSRMDARTMARRNPTITRIGEPGA